MNIHLLVPFGKICIIKYFLNLTISSELTKGNVIFVILIEDGTHESSININIILGKLFLHNKRLLKTQINFYTTEINGEEECFDLIEEL